MFRWFRLYSWCLMLLMACRYSSCVMDTDWRFAYMHHHGNSVLCTYFKCFAFDVHKSKAELSFVWVLSCQRESIIHQKYFEASCQICDKICSLTVQPSGNALDIIKSSQQIIHPFLPRPSVFPQLHQNRSIRWVSAAVGKN
ncbi:hypothetical protein RvY_09794 [Ramazzottius varieornatus]|uniref:Secreted protein n=1 Tax=Ramazzottius varieornatus TaxID=947166 RepID=A0A1D1VCQ8_RAMVA|nr:hypothetical protein RvY_09794 [Ramazzottius varieornatus]